MDKKKKNIKIQDEHKLINSLNYGV